MKFGVACNKLDDSREAGRKAAEGAVQVSGKPTLTFVFTTDFYDHKVVLETVKEAVGNSKILGFCARGIIFAEDMLEQAVAVGTLAGAELSVATSLQQGITEDSYSAGHRAGEELLASGISKGLVIVLPDGFTGNNTEVIRGLYNVMGPDFIYIGGSSGGNLKSSKTYQFTEVGVKSDALAVALLGGMSINAGVVHGWKPTQALLVITKSEGKRVYEIDGCPAFDIYSERLGADTVDNFIKLGKQYPLGIPDVSGNYLIRDPKSVNDDKSVNFVSEIPANSVANIMEGSVKDQIEADKSLISMIIDRNAEPQFALVFDCISRSLLMGKEFKKELKIIWESIGREVPVFGALTHGEIGSFMGAPMFHNKTLALAVLSSK